MARHLTLAPSTKALITFQDAAPHQAVDIPHNAEAKAAGIKMGDPWHLARRRPEVRAALAEWLSSNYAL